MSFNYEPLLAAAAAAIDDLYACACINSDMYCRRRQVLVPSTAAAATLFVFLAIIESSGIDCDQRLNQFGFSLTLALLRLSSKW